MHSTSNILILDFGSQYTQIIARRIRECHVYSEIVPYHASLARVQAAAPSGIILSGGPSSACSPEAPTFDKKIYELGVPILGICYGIQIIARDFGGIVERSSLREYGPGVLHVDRHCPLFHGLPDEVNVWSSHRDRIVSLPEGFSAVGRTENSPYAAIAFQERRIYGLQFHPEVTHTPCGKDILQNFLTMVCKCTLSWTSEAFIARICRELREKIGEGQVMLGLSGGVDSYVAAALLQRAVGKQLTCVFVDNGLLRAGESQIVNKLFTCNFHGIRLKMVDASRSFFSRLRGIIDPERKRKVIGNEFVRIFQVTAQQLQASLRCPFHYLAQGTLYPDVIESTSPANNSLPIKSHHNVAGLPPQMEFELIEPLRHLFKDEVRKVGLKLGLPQELIYRQPFPGPGLAVRILGKITRRRLHILRGADAIVTEEMQASGWYCKVWQSFAILLPVRSVGVMGDERTYENTVAIRIVESRDGMTANWVPVPHSLLAKISSRITNEISGVNRVCYDISSKPPATIEWE